MLQSVLRVLLLGSNDVNCWPSSILGWSAASRSTDSSTSLCGTEMSIWDISFVLSICVMSFSIALLNYKPKRGLFAFDDVSAYLNLPFDSSMRCSLLSMCFFLFYSKFTFAASIFSFFSASHYCRHFAIACSFSWSYFSYLSLVFSVFSFLRVKSKSALICANFSYLSCVHSSIICSISS